MTGSRRGNGLNRTSRAVDDPRLRIHVGSLVGERSLSSLSYHFPHSRLAVDAGQFLLRASAAAFLVAITPDLESQIVSQWTGQDGVTTNLTLAEKHWLQAALSLMGFEAFLGVCSVPGVGEYEDEDEDEDKESGNVLDDDENVDVVVVVALASVNEHVSHGECNMCTYPFSETILGQMKGRPW